MLSVSKKWLGLCDTAVQWLQVSALLRVSERRRHTQEPADEGHGSAQITGTIVILLAFMEGMGGGGGGSNRQTRNECHVTLNTVGNIRL